MAAGRWKCLVPAAVVALACSAGHAGAQGNQVLGAFGNVLNGLVQGQQQQQRAQEQANRAYQQQQYDAQARADAAQRQDEYNRQQASIRQAAAIRARRDAEAREVARRNAEAAQAAAEASPDNRCAERDSARLVMDGFNNLTSSRGRAVRVIDIAHMTTESFVSDRSEMACHGEFMMSNGSKLNGTLKLRRNIAGDPIVEWVADRR